MPGNSAQSLSAVMARRRMAPNCSCLLESIGIVALFDDTFAINAQLVRCSDSGQTVDVNR